MLPPVRNMVSLGEGGTPSHRTEWLAKNLGIRQLFLKDETRNPTDSYRDRAAALLASNTIDGAACSAKADLTCQMIVPKVVDVGKLAQMLAYDAVIEESGEILDDSIRKASTVPAETGWYQATAELNPLVVEAQKAISYEVFEQLDVPEWVLVPMGRGELSTPSGSFKELKQLSKTSALPKLVGVQPEGCATIFNAPNKSEAQSAISSAPFTQALAVLVAEPCRLTWP